MKKTLLGTAAAIACLGFTSGAQAEGGKINLSLGGYYNGLMAFTDTEMDERSYKFGSDSEVHVKGDMTLDNGMVVGFKAEFELENDGDDGHDDSVDEAYIWFKGGFGKAIFGQQDGVGDTFAVNSTHALKRSMNNDTKNDALGLVMVNTTNDTSDDYMKITYMTPAFSGLKLGISFTPEAEKNGQGYTDTDEDAGDEIVEFGGVYMRKMDNVDFSMSSTYVIADDDGAPREKKEWNIGAKVAVEGFTFGGSYRDSEGFGAEISGTTGTYEAYEFGVSYETGPWLVSVQYAEHEAVHPADYYSGDKEEGTQTFVQARYQVTKGFQIGAGVQFADREIYDDYSDTSYSDDGTALVIETHLTF